MTRMEEMLELPYEDEYVTEGDKVREDGDKEFNKDIKEKEKIVNEINGKEHNSMTESFSRLLDLVASLKENYAMGNVIDLCEAFSKTCSESNTNALIEAICSLEIDEDDRSRAIDCLHDIYESLNEAIPAELAQAYKNAHLRSERKAIYTNYGKIRTAHPGQGKLPLNSRAEIDFQNSNYEKITPEQAKALKKSGEIDKVAVVFDKGLVRFDADGKQSFSAIRGKLSPYNSTEDKYVHKGASVDSTSKMSFDEIVDNADAIYKVDEVEIDQNLRYERSLSTDSEFNQDVPNSYFAPMRGNSKATSLSKKDLLARIKDYEEMLKDAKERAKRAEAKGDTRSLSYANSNAEYYEQQINACKRQLGGQRDIAAWRKDYQANTEISKNVKTYKQLKDDITQAKRALEYANNKADDYTSGATPRSSDQFRSKLDKLKQEMARIQFQIMRTEARLENADEDDSDELARLTQDVNRKLNALNSLNSQLDTLMRRGDQQ